MVATLFRRGVHIRMCNVLFFNVVSNPGLLCLFSLVVLFYPQSPPLLPIHLVEGEEGELKAAQWQSRAQSGSHRLSPS